MTTFSAAPSAAYHPRVTYRGTRAAIVALGLAAALAGGAHAQTPLSAASKVPAADPKYTVAQIAQAFGLIDTNKDGKLSHAEAAGFRGVARHFDEADTNKDGSLSRAEFENALSSEKRR